MCQEQTSTQAWLSCTSPHSSSTTNPFIIEQEERAIQVLQVCQVLKEKPHKTSTHYLKLHSFDILMETAEQEMRSQSS